MTEKVAKETEPKKKKPAAKKRAKAPAKAKAVAAWHEEPPKMVSITSIGNFNVKLLMDAMWCEVNNRKLWGTEGRPSQGYGMDRLPRIAKLAATLTAGPKCFFCGKAQKERSMEEAMNLHPGSQLCNCINQEFSKTVDFIPNWHIESVGDAILEKFQRGELLADDLVCRRTCKRCQARITITVEKFSVDLAERGRLRGLRCCSRCFLQQKAEQAARVAKEREMMNKLPNPVLPSLSAVTAPKDGHGVHLKKAESVPEEELAKLDQAAYAKVMVASKDQQTT